jgi:hypothetical protein
MDYFPRDGMSSGIKAGNWASTMFLSRWSAQMNSGRSASLMVLDN